MWSVDFYNAICDVGDGMKYNQAADRLKLLLSKNLLSLTDIIENPAKFFEAHRILGKHATKMGPGFFIRFTVHYNLFAGTVVALGSEKQLQSLLARNASRPRLGCFGLTEVLAGVNSGLVVNTTAHFKDGKFIINTPGKHAAKNWISQGLVAEEGIVAATLYVNGVNYGPQAFLVKMRDEYGKLVSGITVEDMGTKTVGNDLDNARISFSDLSVDLDSLLCKYIQVSANGSVTSSKVKTMEMLGQRLFTGRICVAEAALAFSETLYSTTAEFAKKKECWAPQGTVMLAQVPQVSDLLSRGSLAISKLQKYIKVVEAELCKCLISSTNPPLELQQAIAVAKVRCLEDSIQWCHQLKQEVGSYALMAGTGFEQFDFLQCCKFAEGDSRILMQKMARDLYGKGATTVQERQAVNELKLAVEKELSNGLNKFQAWDKCWKLVYQLANVHMQGIIDKVLSTSKL